MNSKNSRELPKDRLATTDEKGKRVFLYPAEVKGFFRRHRNFVHTVLIIFFLVLPWIRIGGHQAVLLNIAERKFSIFGILFWAHDAPMLVFIFGGAALTLGFITAVWGRVWCGWACPQTVFIDSVFRRIEIWIEGDHLARKKLDDGVWDADKIFKKTVKWFFFLVISLVISHSFLAYFIGTEELRIMMIESPLKNVTSFSMMFFISAVLLFDFGWFREQFCTVVCPYGRFQSLLMDNDSMVVLYDTKRGEPRRGTELSGQPQGHCVNCYKCVQVCPTGIDIRRGTQLECIACTACIDACDDVMTRLQLPKGLIRYEKKKTFRPRTIGYSILILLIALGLFLTLHSRRVLDVTVLRSVGAPYQSIGVVNGEELFTNRFKIEIVNQGFDDFQIALKLKNFEDKVSIASAEPVFFIKAGSRRAVEIFITYPKKILSFGKATLILDFINTQKNPEEKLESREVTLVGPY